MWQEAKTNDKRIRELMVDHRKRAERRRAYYESRLGDPLQLIRVIGSSTKVYPDAEQFYYHENPDNLMPWQGNPDIKIDRFDGRSLLDFVPEPARSSAFQDIPREDREITEELNFERYHDLIEAERLDVSEADRLAEVEEEWTKLLDRHQAKLAMLNNEKKGNNGSTKNSTFGFDYGTQKATEEELEEEDNNEAESQLLKEADILQYVDDLTDKDKELLNEMSAKYGIHSYARLLRVAKKDRDEELRALKRRQHDGKPRDGNRSSRRNERRRRRRNGRNRDDEGGDQYRYRRRHSPSYAPYGKDDDDDSESSEEEEVAEDTNSDFVIEFGSNAPEESVAVAAAATDATKAEDRNEADRQQAPAAPVEKKLTPMEKLKLKMRAGLEKTIASDEKDRRQREREKEREKEIENLQQLAKSQGLPISTYLRPEAPTREQYEKEQANRTRYRSPSTSSDEEDAAKPSAPKRYRSPSPQVERRRSRSRDRKRYTSPSPGRSRRRSSSRDRQRKHSSSSSSRDRYHRRHRSRSPSYKRRNTRSPSNDRRSSYSKSTSSSRRHGGSRR